MTALTLPRNFQFEPILPTSDRGVSDLADRLHAIMQTFTMDRRRSISLEGRLLDTFSELETIKEECSVENWDGSGGAPVDSDSLIISIRFLRCLPSIVALPDVSLDPDGEISLNWYGDAQTTFSVSIAPNGELAYAGVFGLNRIHGVEHFNEKLPRAILEGIHRVSSGEQNF